MGITPTLPLELARLPRPDVAHVFGFRDVVTTGVAVWCQLRNIPYVFEPLGMLKPKLRKVAVKRVFDASVVRSVVSSASVIVATSAFERAEIVETGVDPARVAIRGNGFPAPESMPRTPGALRKRLGLRREPVVLYVGRIAAGKGIDHLLAAARMLPEVHVALIGPDDRHGVMQDVRAAQCDPATAGRVHILSSETRPLELYGDADVFVLASEGESFGMVAAEAAAAGTPVVVTDRCGVADFRSDRRNSESPAGSEAGFRPTGTRSRGSGGALLGPDGRDPGAALPRRDVGSWLRRTYSSSARIPASAVESWLRPRRSGTAPSPSVGGRSFSTSSTGGSATCLGRAHLSTE
jgi:glycosyltransferase involved in cell wall biosynthesis